MGTIVGVVAARVCVERGIYLFSFRPSYVRALPTFHCVSVFLRVPPPSEPSIEPHGPTIAPLSLLQDAELAAHGLLMPSTANLPPGPVDYVAFLARNVCGSSMAIPHCARHPSRRATPPSQDAHAICNSLPDPVLVNRPETITDSRRDRGVGRPGSS